MSSTPLFFLLKAQNMSSYENQSLLFGGGVLKETVNDLDKAFIFQLRNLSPRETRGLPQVTWPGQRVACRLPPFPA